MKRIRAVRVVTAKHGEVFAAEWFDLNCRALEMVDVFAAAGIMVWPDDPKAQAHFGGIEDEILERTFAAARPAIAEAFVGASNAVLARERRKRRPVISTGGHAQP